MFWEKESEEQEEYLITWTKVFTSIQYFKKYQGYEVFLLQAKVVFSRDNLPKIIHKERMS